MPHTLTRRYTLYEESLKNQVKNRDFQRWVLGFGRRDFPASILIFLGSLLTFGLSFVGGCLLWFWLCGSAQAVFFAEIQLCEFAFLKADLLAEMAFSLVW
ncbi:hypothetical protein ACVD4U_004249 [Vibrio vulnificus]